MTLIEALISTVIFLIGVTGIMQMQLISRRSTTMARKLEQATGLAQDLVANTALWPYGDPRLVPIATVASVTDAQVQARALDTHAATVSSAANKAQYGELASTNALNPSALKTGTSPYDGLSADVDGDGTPDFERYWNVFGLDSDGDGVLEGKLIVVIVRWKEGSLGYRRISEVAFRANQGSFLQ